MHARFNKAHLVVFALIFGAIGAYSLLGPRAIAATCVGTPTTIGTFADNVTNASPGAMLCLASGDYGTFFGTGNNKALTLQAADGATPTIVFDLGTNDSNLTFDGFAGISGTTDPVSLTNLTFRNNTFTDRAWMRSTAAPTNIVFDNNAFLNIDPHAGDVAGRLYFDGSSTNCGYVAKNNTFQGGSSDGVRVGCRNVQILDNSFKEFNNDCAGCHVDPIQVYGGNQVLIKGNYFQQTISHIGSYLTMTNYPDSIQIENNVFRAGSYDDIGNLGGITNSTFIHNTIEKGICIRSTCGTAVIDDGLAHQATITIRDNILVSALSGGSAVIGHNLIQTGSASGTDFTGTPLYVGTNPNTIADFALIVGSPGKHAASDGTDVGINEYSASSTPADINQDDQVDTADLGLLLSSYGQTTTQCTANNSYKCDLSAPTDNKVNVFDLSKLLSRYGT